MPGPFGPDIGTTERVRARTKAKLPGQTETFIDLPLNENPWAYVDTLRDFEGPQETFVLEVPLYDVTNDANTILVGANSRGRVKVPRAGRLIAAHMTAEDALATDTTNHLTFTVVNELASGSGTAEMLSQTTGAHTTDSDNASAVAITAKTGRAFAVSGTAASLVVNAGDHILITATVGGTLANAVDLPVFYLTFATMDKAFTPRATYTAGSPLVGPVDDTANGETIITLSATSEAQTAGFDWADQLLIPANKGWIWEARVKVNTTAITTAESVIIGMASAYNATFDSTTTMAWFLLAASMALLAETDDGTTDNDDQSCVTTLVADTYYYLRIDASNKSAVEFWVNNKRVKTLSASAWSASMLLQPVCHVRKASGTTTPSVTVDLVRLRVRRA
jgi:hypothetical protein